MAVSAFSEDGKYYSNISKDGRLRIWDTETNILKQEYTPDLHLTSPPSCLQWINVAISPGSLQKGGKRKQSIREQETQCIALGTSNGKILIYSVTQAKIDNVLSSEKERGSQNIKSLDWHRRYGLYSCNRAGFVFEWDLQSASVRNKYNVIVDSKSKQGNGVSAIKIVPHYQETTARFLVTASWQVCLWRLQDSEATIVKHLGHNTSPGVLLSTVTINKSTWLIEGSQNERLLSFWDVTVSEEHLPQVNGDGVTPSKRQRKKSITISNPTYNFVLEDAPKFVDLSLINEDGTNLLKMAATTRSGVVHYYGHLLNGSSVKPIKPSVTVQVTTSEAVPLQLTCCRLAQNELLLGYTSGPSLLFEKVTPDLSSKTQILIRGEPTSTKKKKQTNEVNKVQADTSTDVTYVEPLGGVSRKRTTPGGQVEVPMEMRLQNLSLDPKSRSKTAVSQNLTKLLIQGLHSKDRSIILTVLQRNDEEVAMNTVSKLPASYVPLLLEQLEDMAAKRTSQCASVCTWTWAVVRRHAALVTSCPHSATELHLTHLLALFLRRRAFLCQLLNLKGRIELTMSQRSSRTDTQDNQEPVLSYNDTSSEDEMEGQQYHSSSEHSWSDRASEHSDSDDS